MRAITLIFCLVCIFVCSMPLFGDVVTSGSIQITGSRPFGVWTLAGDNFTTNGIFEFGSWHASDCEPCMNGFVNPSVDGSVLSSDFGAGAATVNGMDFPFVGWSDAKEFTFFFVHGPGFVIDHGAGTYYSTFNFVGTLCGTLGIGLDQCVVNLPNLVGSGTVAVDIQDDGGGFLEFQQATYTFQPIPEPSGLLLFGSGILGLGGALRRKIQL